MLSALVLAAGLGTRLDPITRLVAKPAVPLGQRTLIEHVLAWLRGQQVRDVVVNLHHLPTSLTSVLGDGRHLDMTIRYSWEAEVLGSAGGPRRALPLLGSDPFLIVNGDTLCDVALAPMLERHIATSAEVTMAVIPNPAPSHYNGILLGDDDEIVGFVPRGHSEPSWHFVGVQIAHHEAFAQLEDGVPCETVAGLYRDRVATAPGRIRAWRTQASFLDVGTPRDYLIAALQQPSTTPGTGAKLTRTIVWPGVTFDDDVELEDCIVAGPLHVPAGTRAHTAILIPASAARQDDHMRRQGDVAIYPMDLGHGRA